MWKRLHVKCPLFLSDVNKTWILSTHFRKSLKSQISSKSVHWEPSCFIRTDMNFLDRFFKKSWNLKISFSPSIGNRAVLCGRTEMTKLIIAFRNFPNAPQEDNLTRFCKGKDCALLGPYRAVPQSVDIARGYCIRERTAWTTRRELTNIFQSDVCRLVFRKRHAISMNSAFYNVVYVTKGHTH
jgi:hypothetical protein